MWKILSVLFGIMIIIDGVVCLALPELTFLTLGYLVGVGMLLDGIGRIINWFQLDRGTEQSGWVLVSAVISLTLGMILMGSEAMQLVMDAFIVNMAIANKYLKINPNFIGDLNDLNNKNTIIRIGDDKKNQYHNIKKIMNGYDKFITLKNTDSILFAEPTYDYNEKKLVDIQNELALINIESYSIPKDGSILQHASSEDLMMMYDLLKPKYYMPVEGEYRYMVNNANLIYDLGMPKENIILKQNGEFVTFENGVLQDKQESIKINEVLIDGAAGEDVGELVIKDTIIVTFSKR